jgi:hypothetical protein
MNIGQMRITGRIRIWVCCKECGLVLERDADITAASPDELSTKAWLALKDSWSRTVKPRGVSFWMCPACSDKREDEKFKYLV